MIVVDEQLHSDSFIAALESWYPGAVRSIVELRPATVIKDDAIPALLLTQRQPTFITINANDFWQRIDAHSGYCIVAFPLTMQRRHEASSLLRKLLSHERFRTKAVRMGTVVRVTPDEIAYYDINRHYARLEW